MLLRDTLQALYVQLAQTLERDIVSGRCAPFSRLPSEQELMASYQVSRTTVRQAIGLLMKKGLIEVKQGKGTFVAGPLVRHGLDNLTGFYDSLVAQGLNPSTNLLEFHAATGAERASTALKDDARPVIALRRLYLVRGRPFAVVDAVVASDGTRPTREQAETHTIYSLLREVLGEQVTRADIGIRAVSVGKKIGSLLKLAPGRPVLLMQRVSVGTTGRPVEHSFFHIVPENYEFQLSVSGPLQISCRIQPFGTARTREGPRATVLNA